MDEKLGEYAGKLYAQLHFGLDASEQEQTANRSADRVKPNDRLAYVTGWIAGYQSVDSPNPPASTEQTGQS